MVFAIGAFANLMLFFGVTFALGFMGLEAASIYRANGGGGGEYTDAEEESELGMFDYSKPYMVPVMGFFGPAKINIWDFTSAGSVITTRRPIRTARRATRPTHTTTSRDATHHSTQ